MTGGLVGLAIFLPVQILKQVVEFPVMCHTLVSCVLIFSLILPSLPPFFFLLFWFVKGASVVPILESGKVTFPRSHGFWMTEPNKCISVRVTVHSSTTGLCLKEHSPSRPTGEIS